MRIVVALIAAYYLYAAVVASACLFRDIHRPSASLSRRLPHTLHRRSVRPSIRRGILATVLARPTLAHSAGATGMG
jgi:hypothetical protein